MPFGKSLLQKLATHKRSTDRKSSESAEHDPPSDQPPPYEQTTAISTPEKSCNSGSDAPSFGEPPKPPESSTSVNSTWATFTRNRSKKPPPNLYISEDSLDFKLPPTARFLLGLQDDTDHLRKYRNPPCPVDPARFDFELVCLRCYQGSSRCGCISRTPTTALRLAELPAIEAPYGTFHTPFSLIKRLGMRDTHLAAAVAGTFWPVISLGMIPIYDVDTFVMLTSRTIEQGASARAVVATMAKPVHRSTETLCCCGCRESICAQVAIRHRLYEDPDLLSKATATGYTIGTVALTAVDLGNGTTCVIGEHQQPVDVNTDFLDDFFLLRALRSPSLWTMHSPTKHETLPSWETVLAGLLAETLARAAEPYLLFDRTKLWSTNTHPEGERLVVRAELFGSGTGYMVLDKPAGAIKTSETNEMMPPYSYYLPVQIRLSKASPNVHSTRRDCRTAPVGEGWEHLSFEKQAPYPQFNVGKEAVTKISLLPPGRPLRGFPCTKKCSGKVLANCNGFTAPAETETTVYILGADPLPFLAVSQYSWELGKPLYFIDGRTCLGCTVTRAPAGSIIAGMLPEIII